MLGCYPIRRAVNADNLDFKRVTNSGRPSPWTHTAEITLSTRLNAPTNTPPHGVYVSTRPQLPIEVRQMIVILKQVYLVTSHKVQVAFKDLMIHEVCRSHDISHFAAFFIVARAKRSIVKSCF